MRGRLGNRTGRRGQALIEFALVALQLFVVIIASVELARVLVIYTNIANAARVGVRYAMTHGESRGASGVVGPDGPSGPAPNPPEVIKVIRFYAQSGLVDVNRLISGTQVDYLPPAGLSGGGCNSPGCRVRVTIRYNYDPLIILPLGVPLGTTSQGVITF
jgi:hypothetical protein